MGGELDFDDSPDDKPDFVRYAVELRCQNPVTDTKEIPPLEESAEATETLFALGLKPSKVPRKDLLKLLHTACILEE